jgi:cytochrome P450
MTGVRIAFPQLTKLASYIPLPVFTSAYASVQRLQAYAEESIKRYERLISAEPHNPKPTLFTKLFNAGDEHMPHAEIVANARAYIVAGSDTTAISMTYLTWAVCRNPSIKARLVEELSGLPDNYVDEDLKKLSYLDQVIIETLRVYAAAPGYLPREVSHQGREIDGYWMPAGTEVGTQAYSMHRDPTVFVNPERFDPSRWASPSKEMKDAWMPFGGGARVCIGLHLAQVELRVATAAFFRKYPNAKVSTLDGFTDDDMEQIVYFLMYPKNKRCLIQAS